ncbi:MAG TPA: substrate-binding domain-containing protein [Kineosporiaceae bacterium]|nr:substrate-binding domain-containing protein [Kineosporiaceae bacterium]
MRRQLVAAFAVGTAGLLALSACGSSDSATPGGDAATSAAVKGKVGVILPDTASSVRWENNDRPLLKAAFDAAGIESDIQNAGGDKTKFQTIADGMISAGVKVLLIVNLDSPTGAAVVKKATAAGIPTIDYDRLTLGGGSKYYVSFDNTAVGTAIGTGLVKCLTDSGKKPADGGIVELNGSPTDNNATLFKNGYDKVIKDAGYSVVADQSVPDWDNGKAGTLFEQIYTQQKGKFIGVAAANDGLGGAVVARLKKQGLAGKIPVTGQDATDEGLQRVLLGTQCVTVYKAVKAEADAASKLAIALATGDTAAADALATGKTNDSTTKQDVPSVLLTPVAIYPENVKDVVADQFTTADKLCTTAELKKACTKYGVS